MIEGGLRKKGVEKKPMLTIITVVFNSSRFLEYTIQSVIQQTYRDFEFIIVDGNSTDGTLDIIKKYEDNIDFWISEPDNGVYDAMNKAIRLAKGEWLNFMNAGDRFVNEFILENIFCKTQLSPTTKFLFSDWYFCDLAINPDKHYFTQASFNEGEILHQSVIYKKELHQIHGMYLVTPKIIISDYLFFCSISAESFLKVPYTISINDRNGLSSTGWCYDQKIAADFIFERNNIEKTQELFVNRFGLCLVLKVWIKCFLLKIRSRLILLIKLR